MGGMVKCYRFENNGKKYKRRCDFCHQARHELYRAQFEESGPMYWLCPGSCISQAQVNYKEKREKGIVPHIENPSVDLPEQITTSNEDNILR